jgi:simple sugar transport system substrate-binding protein
MNKVVKVFIICMVLACLFSTLTVFAGGKKEKEPPPPPREEPEREEPREMVHEGPFDIGIFVPGVVAGSPLYEQLVAGAERVAAEFDHVTIKVLEAGFNQGEWEEKMVSMAATMEYEVILTSNGAMPFVSMPAAEAFPDQKFLIVDSILPGHPQMFTLLYNQVEQAAMVGYLAGLVTKSDMPGATPDLKIGAIVGQEYAAMNEMIIPGYELGAREVDERIELDFRVLGNWYDANKAAELANSMFDAGVDVVMTACGGANQGVIQAAQDRGKYVLYLDDDHYELAPGTIIGCAALMQERAVFHHLVDMIEGRLPFGEAIIMNVREGYVDFVDWNPLYEESVPPDIREQMAMMLEAVRSGEISLEVPVFW